MCSTINTNLSTDVMQEIINHRGDLLHNLHPNEITTLVFRALEAIAPGSPHGLQGVDASDQPGDGVTGRMWEQAICALEMGTELVLPGWDGESQPVPAVCSFELCKNLVAGRVAKSILLLNGYVNLTYDELTALHRHYHDEGDHICSGPSAR